MIKLDIREYCQDCAKFEPQVAQRPTQFASLCDTIVECENTRQCEALYNHLKRRKEN